MKLGNDLFIYILILIFLSFVAFFSVELYILLSLLFSFIYLPLLFSLRYYKPTKKGEKMQILSMGEDIQHFRDTVDKALKGNAVAQRDIELRLINSFVIALSVRYDLPETLIRKNLENENFLKKYVGEKAKLIADIYKRRHELKLSLPKERFLKDIEEIMEAIE